MLHLGEKSGPALGEMDENGKDQVAVPALYASEQVRAVHQFWRARQLQQRAAADPCHRPRRAIRQESRVVPDRLAVDKQPVLDQRPGEAESADVPVDGLVELLHLKRLRLKPELAARRFLASR